MRCWPWQTSDNRSRTNPTTNPALSITDDQHPECECTSSPDSRGKEGGGAGTN